MNQKLIIIKSSQNKVSIYCLCDLSFLMLSLWGLEVELGLKILWGLLVDFHLVIVLASLIFISLSIRLSLLFWQVFPYPSPKSANLCYCHLWVLFSQNVPIFLEEHEVRRQWGFRLVRVNWIFRFLTKIMLFLNDWHCHVHVFGILRFFLDILVLLRIFRIVMHDRLLLVVNIWIVRLVMLLFRLVRSKRVFVITQVLVKENLKVPHDTFHVAY